MFNKCYIIGNEIINVICTLTEFIDIIEKRMLMFDESKKIDSTNNYIRIYNDKTIYKIGKVEKAINGKLAHTDIYPLFNNILANIINNEEDMLLHSAVLCYNNIGFLVLGDFNHGKTTLCLEASKFNFKILSADQSIIQIKNNHIFLTNGSKYLRVRGEDDLIINEAFGDIEIKYILNLIGLCEYGKATFELITDYKIKTLFKYLTWHSDIPLFTDNSLLNVDRVLIKEWLGKINIPVYNVRGNNIEIINIMKELK